MPVRFLQVGDEVAVIPRADSAPSETIEITTVAFATSVFVQLADGRMFATIGGKCLGSEGYIVPATDEHRAALKRKRRQSG
jgi:hypothetical protein